MNHYQAKDVIEYLRPGVGFNLDGDVFTADTMANVQWPVGRNDKPTWAEMESYLPVALLGPARKKKILETKAEAARRIVALVPSATSANVVIKELNLLMQGLSLIDKKQRGLLLTAAEETALSDYRTLKAKIDAVRDASNIIEADINASADPANFDVIGSLRWPA